MLRRNNRINIASIIGTPKGIKCHLCDRPRDERHQPERGERGLFPGAEAARETVDCDKGDRRRQHHHVVIEV